METWLSRALPSYADANINPHSHSHTHADANKHSTARIHNLLAHHHEKLLASYPRYTGVTLYQQPRWRRQSHSKLEPSSKGYKLYLGGG